MWAQGIEHVRAAPSPPTSIAKTYNNVRNIFVMIGKSSVGVEFVVAGPSGGVESTRCRALQGAIEHYTVVTGHLCVPFLGL